VSVHTPERLLEVAAELTARPRKTLGWKTLAQAMNLALCEPQPHNVATTA
jgi:IS30 family transposase